MLDKALQEDSTFALAFMMKGMVSENSENRRMYIKKAMKYAPQVSEGEQLWIKARNVFYGTQEGDSTEYEYFKKLVGLFPEDPYANYLYGFVNHHHDNFYPDTAVAYLRRSVELDKNFTLAIDDLVYAYLENGDLINARKMASQNVERLPNLADPKNTYAEILMSLGNHQESIESFEKAFALDSTSAWSIIGIAANLNYLNQHSKARKELEKLDNFKDISDYNFRHKWRARVVSYIDEGKLDSAILVLENQKQLGLKKETTHEPLFHAHMSFLRKLNLLFEMGDIENGKREYEEWLQFTKNNISRESTLKNVQDLGDYYIAYEHFHKNRFDHALQSIELYKESITEENAQYKRLMAKILWKKGNPEQALMVLVSTGLEGHSEQYLYASVLLSEGQKNEAQVWVDKINSTYLIDDIDLALTRYRVRTEFVIK